MSAANRSTGVPRPGDAAALIELYFEKGWTDGLPVVPPSEESVGAMLAAAGLRGQDLIGEIPSRHTRITADKVAINAVLAGCKPEYMPLIVAAVKGLCHPDYNYHGPATSTGSAATCLIVSGPIRARLGLNAKDNVLGPGFRANATIGRAVRLLMMNGVNTRPGALDRSTMGNPGKYSMCIAEAEEESPWEPLHVELGYKREESTVTVFAAEAAIQVYNQLSSDPAQLCATMGAAMSNPGSMQVIGQQNIVVLVSGEHAKVFRDAGWSKQQVKQSLWEQGKQSVATLKRVGRLPGVATAEDEGTWRHVTASPEQILVLRAGAQAGAFSTCLPGWGNRAATRAVTLPIEGV